MTLNKKSLFVAFLTMSQFIASAQSNRKTGNTLLEEAKKAIVASNAIYFDAYVKSDPSIFINSYAEDACLLPPNAPMTCGREALMKFITEGLAMGLKKGEFITTNVYGDGKEYVTEEGIGKIYDSTGKVS